MIPTTLVNKLTVVHLFSDGTAISGPPDVCKSPSIPIPYVNVAFSRDLILGSTTVKVDGSPIALKDSLFSTSYGDEPGVGGGVISGVNKGTAKFINYSMDVFVEGRNVCRLTDPMLMNGNTDNTANPAEVQGNRVPPLPPKKQKCDASVTIDRVMRGNPYVHANASAADGMPDSVPPNKTYQVKVTVTPSLEKCPGQYIALSIENGSADNGTATVSPARITKTTIVTVKGGSQTKPGNAGKLIIRAKLDGSTLKADSQGFSVCAHPINYRDTFVADIDGPAVGVVVQDGWDSDTGTFSDLDEAEISEVVEYDAPTSPPYSGGGGANNSGYLPANQLTQDRHTIGRPAAGPAAVWERRQLCIFKCHRCGAVDKVHPHSGFKIVHHVALRGTTQGRAAVWKHHVEKLGAKVTARGYTSEAGSAHVVSPEHTLP